MQSTLDTSMYYVFRLVEHCCMLVMFHWFFTSFLGESPSSSASDIDNLNNVGAVDRTTLTRGSNTLVANNQVISAQNRPNIIRLLDFVSFNLLINLMFHLEIYLGVLILKYGGVNFGI